MATDPVCEMLVNENTASFKSVYQGKTYYFCSGACKLLFERDPEKYLTPKEEQPKEE